MLNCFKKILLWGLASTAVSAAEFKDDAAKYWDFSKLQKAPAYRPSKLAESQVKDLEDILFDGVPYKGKPAPVFAYIGYPKTPMPAGGYPGVLLVHGGGGTAFPDAARLWNKYGFAVLMIDWYNSHPKQEAREKRGVVNKLPLPGGNRNDLQTNVANMVLAHSLLRSLPKVNQDKTVFVGLSWGSWYGATVAALDNRFKGAVEIYCGDIKPVKNHRYLVNGAFLHSAKIPMYWVCSTNDANATPQSLQNAWDVCPTIVNKSIVIRLPHSHVGFKFPSCFRMADHFANGAPMLPKLSKITVKDGVASCKVLNKGKGIIKTVFCYTIDRAPKSKDRKWLEIPAKMEGDTLSVKLPEKILQGYFSAYDEKSRYNDCCGSSDFMFFPEK